MSLPSLPVDECLSEPQSTKVVSPASFGHRLLAFLIDSLICLATVLLAALFLRVLIRTGIWAPLTEVYSTGGPELGESQWDPVRVWRTLGTGAKLLIWSAYLAGGGLFYYVACEASPCQATVGKRVAGICVTDVSGNRITMTRAVARWCVRWQSLQVWLWVVSVFLIVSSKDNRGLHDFCTRTRVITGRPEHSEGLIVWRVFLSLGLTFACVVGCFLLATQV